MNVLSKALRSWNDSQSSLAGQLSYLGEKQNKLSVVQGIFWEYSPVISIFPAVISWNFMDARCLKYQHFHLSLTCVWLLSHVLLFVTLWTVALQAPLCTEFFRQKCWSGLPFPLPGNLPDPGTEPMSPATLALQANGFYTYWATGISKSLPSDHLTNWLPVSHIISWVLNVKVAILIPTLPLSSQFLT